jgi:hypothetical protein
MRTVRSIIEELGGISDVARAHKPPLAPSTVGSWVEKNFVPEWRQPELKRIAKRKKKSLNDNDFPPKDLRLKAVS